MLYLDAYLIRAYFKSDEMAEMQTSIACTWKMCLRTATKNIAFFTLCEKYYEKILKRSVVAWANLQQYHEIIQKMLVRTVQGRHVYFC